MKFKSYIKNADCFDEFKNIKDKTIDLVCVDLPYGQTACKWDSVIDLSKMWDELKRICKEGTVYVFFCTTKFGHSLISSNPKWFRYDLVWEKSKSVGFLSANKIPLRQHEMIYIFSYSGDDLNNERNIELRQYAEKVKKYINKPNKEIHSILGCQAIDHFFRFKSTQFGLPTNKNYNKLIEHFKINEMKYYIKYDEMKKKWGTSNKSTYNPQKIKGKPYTTKGRGTVGVYNSKRIDAINKGDRYPTSIIKFNQPKKSLHNTQKPVNILEWLIKTYSNENDIVLDFTMGSGSAIEACMNTNRKYIGIEKDKDIYLIAKDRLDL
jgi:site-specific DNA-methyltransferase (adenine-specific)